MRPWETLPFIEADFFQNERGRPTMCQGCRVRPSVHEHHKEHKQMGGRKRKAKKKSEDATNKIYLCEVCHGASHLEKVITPDRFSCPRCPVYRTCYYGRLTYGEADADAYPIPW